MTPPGPAPATAPPARGTRPRNRRALIILAATELFHRVGYAKVAMSDIADAVNVRPSALYRHFSGKDELFVAAARAALEPIRAAVETPDRGFDTLLGDLVRAGLGQRAVGVLWQREARHLPESMRAELHADLRHIAETFAERLRREESGLTPHQADLLSWSALAALASLSFHRLHLPGGQFEALLGDILRRIVSSPPPAPEAGPPSRRVAGLPLSSRREAILAVATRLFTARGFAAVTVDDIGEAAGITGPSVYNHFASKQDILTAALNRAGEWLWTEATRAFASATDERDALRRLLDSYLTLALERGDLIAALIADLDEVREPDRHRARQSQHDFITEWVELLRVVLPEPDATAARIRVHAVLTIVNSLAQTPHLRRLPGFAPALRQVAGSLLTG